MLRVRPARDDCPLKVLIYVVLGAGAVDALFPGLSADVMFLTAGSSSVLVNFVIDTFGHTTHGIIMARSSLAQSVKTAHIWGGATGYMSGAAGVNLGAVGRACRGRSW